MVHSGMTQHDPALPADSWWEDNDRGLALSADAEWSEAAEAFAAAADSLARRLPADATAHDALAMVLGNLSQALFRAGRMDDAIQQAQRACALRVALAGEDGMPVARARTDLAVMLAAAGRGDEAMALVQRAIAGIEHRVGDEDARLATVLENGARIALAAGHPANAEPLLLRLHALLDAHELSTARADTLLARVAAVRAKQAQEAALTRSVELSEEAPTPLPTPTPTMTPVSAVLAEVTRTVAEREALEQAQDEDVDALLVPPVSATTPAPSPAPLPPVYVHSSIAADDDWEDQPLRDAVVLTDVLLRTTPSGVPAIPEPVNHTGADDLVVDIVDTSDAVENVDIVESIEITDTAPPAGVSGGIDIEIDIVDAVEPMPSAASRTEASAEPQLEPNVEAPSMLGFTVQHGIVDDPSFDLVEPVEVAEPVHVMEPIEVVEPVSLVEPVNVIEAVETTEAAANAPQPDTPPPAPRQSPRSVSVVLPTPDKGPQAISTEATAPVRGSARKTAAAPNSSKRADATRNEVQSSGGAMRWVAAGGAALAAAGGAVWWFLLR